MILSTWLESLSRQRTELFLAAAEHDRLADLVLTKAMDRSPQHLQSRFAVLLVAIAPDLPVPPFVLAQVAERGPDR